MHKDIELCTNKVKTSYSSPAVWHDMTLFENDTNRMIHVSNNSLEIKGHRLKYSTGMCRKLIRLSVSQIRNNVPHKDDFFFLIWLWQKAVLHGCVTLTTLYFPLIFPSSQVDHNLILSAGHKIQKCDLFF